MTIENFNPRAAGLPREKNLEDKMIRQDVISHEEVKEYADFIISKLKSLSENNQEKVTSFLVDAFSDDTILHKAGVRMSKDLFLLDEKEALGAIKRVRKALMDELKGKLDRKIYLLVENIVKDIPNKNASAGNPYNPERKNIISQVVDVDNDREKIYKEQGAWGEQKYTEEAFLVFNRLAPHPNIAQVKEYDKENHKFIYEKLNFVSLDKYLERGKDSAEVKLITSLKVLRDCIKGAAYLADNGLVLEDIEPTNVGVEKTGPEVKGILFDLEGLIKAGVVKKPRKHKEGYLDWQTFDYRQADKFAVSPYETVWQFGLCLGYVQKYYSGKNDLESKGPGKEKIKKIISDLRNLAEDMVEWRSSKPVDSEKEDWRKRKGARAQSRIDLKEAEERLSKIIDDIEKEKDFV